MKNKVTFTQIVMIIVVIILIIFLIIIAGIITSDVIKNSDTIITKNIK